MTFWPESPCVPLRPLKHTCSLNPDILPEYTDPDLEFYYVDIGNVALEAGIIDSVHMTFANAPSRARKLVKPGDIIVSTVRTYLKAVACIPEDTERLVVSTGFAVLRVKTEADPRFLYRLVQSNPFVEAIVAASTGVSYPAINPSTLGDISVPLPDLPTQKAIAEFLDRETDRIDQLIEKKQRMVEVLEASQESVRDGAVCKGLNPSSSYQESGMVWFGNVPAHWTICKFNRLVSSKVDYRGRTQEKVDAGVFLVTARNIRNGIIDYGRSREFTTEDDWIKLSNRGRPNIGDVIFTTEAPLGQIAQVDRTDVAFAQRILKFQANEKLVTNDFLAQLMMSASFQHSLRLFASGSTADGIKSERLAHLFGLAPPMEEQLEIVAFIERQIDRARNIVISVERSIDLLREFRSALITAVVTGQIDVSTWGKQGTADHRLDRIEETSSP